MITVPGILDTAKEFFTGERQETHGDAAETHGRIAVLWNAYETMRRNPASPKTGRDVAAMLALMKLARMEGGKFNADNAVDMAAYVAIMGALDAPADPAT
jgi:hypothetical protein